MEPLFAFLLRASAGIMLFYMVYWLFLRYETFYRANRWYLLFALILAVLLPLSPLHYSVLVEPEKNTPIFQELSNTFKNIQPVQPKVTETTGSFGWRNILLTIYVTGAVIFLIRLLAQTVVLIRLMLQQRINSLDGLRVVENEKYGLPFSFFNIVFINPKFHTPSNLPEILAHEKVHIRENHWFDLLFTELLTVIFWFNPFIWMFEHAIKQNHEYLADQGVLAQGHSVVRYQALLINQLMGMQIIGITNNLNFALNTNRFKMMTKMKTTKIKKLKLIWALPALALLLYAFAEPRYVSQNNENTIKQSVGNSEKELVIKGKVTRESNGKPLPGVSVILKGTTLGTITDMDGEFKMSDFDSGFLEKLNSNKINLVFSYVGLKTIVKELSIDNKTNHRTMSIDDVKLQEEYIGIGQIDNSPSVAMKEKNKKEDVMSNPSSITSEKTNSGGVKEQTVFFVVEEMPEFPGGSSALENLMKEKRGKFMASELFKNSNLSGKKVFIGFTVDTDGSVINPVLNGPNFAGYTIPEMSETVKQKIFNMVTEMPKWSPGKQRGKPVPVKYTIPFVF